MGGFVLFWHKGLGFCPRGVLSQRGFVLEGFCPEGFCPRGFCPTPRLGTYYEYTPLHQCEGCSPLTDVTLRTFHAVWTPTVAVLPGRPCKEHIHSLRFLLFHRFHELVETVHSYFIDHCRSMPAGEGAFTSTSAGIFGSRCTRKPAAANNALHAERALSWRRSGNL